MTAYSRPALVPEEIALVEFDSDGRPWNIQRRNEYGTFDDWCLYWCRRDGRIYANNAGSGWEPVAVKFKEGVTYWLAPGYGPPEGGVRLPELPSEWSLENLTDLLDDQPVEWCSVCQDDLPTERLCEHIWFCEECSDYSRPGERCEHPGPVYDLACYECDLRFHNDYNPPLICCPHVWWCWTCLTWKGQGWRSDCPHDTHEAGRDAALAREAAGWPDDWKPYRGSPYPYASLALALWKSQFPACEHCRQKWAGHYYLYQEATFYVCDPCMERARAESRPWAALCVETEGPPSSVVPEPALVLAPEGEREVAAEMEDGR